MTHEPDQQFLQRLRREKGPPSTTDVQRVHTIERKRRAAHLDEILMKKRGS